MPVFHGYRPFTAPGTETGNWGFVDEEIDEGMAAMAGPRVGFGWGVERASAVRAFLVGVSVETAGVVSLATGAGVALAVRLSAVLVFLGGGTGTTAGVVTLATGAGVALAVRLSAERVLDGSAGFGLAGSDSAARASAARASAAGECGRRASTDGFSTGRVLTTGGLDRKPILGGAVGFASSAGPGGVATLAGTRDFSHWSRCSASSNGAAPRGSVVCPSDRATGNKSAEAKTTRTTNLPEGGKTMFKVPASYRRAWRKGKASEIAKMHRRERAALFHPFNLPAIPFTLSATISG